MAGIETGAAIEAIKFLKEAYDAGWFDKLIVHLKKKHRVLVLGATGAGKTAFLKSLKTVVPEAIDVMNRTEFVEKFEITLSKRPFIFKDTPGQIHHAARRREAIKETLKLRGGIAGVINLVSSGYHESRAVPKPRISAEGQVEEEFLEAQRQVELALLSEWTPLLGGTDSANWLITVVTKADLWWPQRVEVMKYYETGPYFQALGEAQALKPVVLEYSSVFQKFYGEGAMAGGFQDADRIRAKARIIQMLLAAINE